MIYLHGGNSVKHTVNKILRTVWNIFNGLHIEVSLFCKGITILCYFIILLSIFTKWFYNFLGAFSEKYEQKPELLSVVFPIILLKGLNSAETVLFATSALKDICKDNNKLIEPYSDDIISVCHQKISSNTLSVCSHHFSSNMYITVCLF